jgi:hypothetical protein
LPEAKTKDQYVDECLLQDDLEDKEGRLDFITQPETVLVANKVREDLKLEETTKKSFQKQHFRSHKESCDINYNIKARFQKRESNYLISVSIVQQRDFVFFKS